MSCKYTLFFLPDKILEYSVPHGLVCETVVPVVRDDDMVEQRNPRRFRRPLLQGQESALHPANPASDSLKDGCGTRMIPCAFFSMGLAQNHLHVEHRRGHASETRAVPFRLCSWPWFRKNTQHSSCARPFHERVHHPEYLSGTCYGLPPGVMSFIYEPFSELHRRCHTDGLVHPDSLYLPHLLRERIPPGQSGCCPPMQGAPSQSLSRSCSLSRF